MAHKKNKHQSLTDHDKNEVDNRSNINSNASMNNTNSGNVDPQPQNKARKQKNKRTNHHSNNNNNNNNNTVASSSSSTTTTTASRTPSPTNNNNNSNSNNNNNSSSSTTKKRKRSKAFNRKQQVHHANEEEESEDDVSNNTQPTTMDSSSSSSSSSSTGALSFSEDSHKKKKKKRNRNRKRQKLNNQQQEQEEEQDTHSNSNKARKKRKKYPKNQTTSSSNNNNNEEEEDEDMNTNNNNTNLFERIIQSLASSSSNSGDSESSSSGGDLFGGIISGGGALRLSNEKVNQLLTQLSEDAGMGENYDAVSELCHFLSMSNEQSLSQVSRIGEFVPHLVRLLQSDENYDLALVSARALTNMIDAMPATSHFLIRDGAIAVFIEKLLNIEYIDLAEQCIQCLYVMICQNVGVTVSSSSGQMNRTSSAAIHHHLHLQQQQQHRHHHHHHGSSRLLSYMNDFDSPISAALSTPLLKSGVLMAVLMFIDFFSLDIQRKIALVASQLCRRITSEDLFESAVKDAIPNLIQFLHSSDSKIVECGCKCFYRIACALANNDEKLQYLIQVSNGQILDQFYNILSLDGDDGNTASHNTAVNKSAVSRATLSSVINFFTIVSHGSFSVCQMLHERGIAIMLSTLLEHGREDHESNAAVQDDVDDGDTDMENSASGVDLTQNSSNSNNGGGSPAKLSTNNSYSSRVIKEHLGEILQLLLELLPDRSLDNKNAHHTDDINFVTELSPQTRKMLLQTMATPVQYLEWDSVKQLSSPSSSASTQPPAPSSSPHALLSQLRRMASTQQQLASSSSSSSSEERTQFEQKKSLFEKNPDLLINFGQCMIPLLIDMFSSTHVEHVANRCLTVIGTVLYFSTPDMLKTMLLTIPISTFISSVLASPRLIQVATAIQFAEILMSKLPDIFSEYLVREGVLYQIRKLSGCEVNDKKVSLMLDMMKTKVLKEYQKAEKTQKEQQEKLDRAKKEKAEQEEAEKNSNAGNQMTDDDNEEQESKQATTATVDKVHFVPPKVRAPDPPVSSALSSQKCDHSTMTSLELLSYVVAVAQLFQQKYFADSSKFNSVVVSKLSDLASELKSFVDDPSESEELECLKSIRSMLIEGVSNFEVFSSGIISALNNYLTKLSTEIGHDDDVNSVHVQRFRRICTFCKVFDQRIEDPAQPTTVGGASQQLHQSPYRVNRSDSLTRSPGFSPLSLRRTSLRMASDLQPPHTYLIELVRKVQDCLTSVENFGLIVNEHHGLLQSVAHTVHALSKPMKLRITKRGPTDSKKKAVVFEVMISPLAELSTVLQFLQSRSSKQKDESSEDSPQKKQKREQEESEKQEVEDEEGLEDDDDVDEDEEEDDEEEVKTPHENVNVSTSATSYFEVEEEEEEDFNGSRLTNTVDITESKKSTSSPSTSSSSSSQADNRYKFLDEQSDIDEKDKDQQQGPIAFQLYMNGKLLNPLESVFQALYSHTRKPGKTLQHPATMRLWDSTHSMEYEEVLASSLMRTSLPSSSSPFVQQENDEPEDEEDWQVAVSSKRDRKSQQQKRVLSEKRRSISQSGIIKYATIDSLNESQTAKESLEKLDAVNRLNIALDRDFASVLTLNSVGGVDEDAVSCLNLLRLINLLNVNTDILPHIEKIGEEKRNRLIMKREFINAKLQSKLIRQLQDPYILFTKCMPSWVTQLISHCGFLFSYDTRKLYFHLNFGIARAIKRIQERQLRNENNHNVKRNSNMVRMEKQKIKLAREPNFLQSAFKVIEKHGVTKAVLEFEYENEEGTGLGPTLEFYTLVSAELQKAKLNIWKDEYTAEDDSNDKQNEDSYHNRTVKSSCGLFPKPIDSDDVVAVSKARRIFRFLGRFVARALYDDRIVDLPFSNALYKAIQGHKLQYHDLKLIDPILYKQLESMRALVQEKHKIESSSTSDKNKQKKAVESLTLGNDGKTTIDMLYQVFVLPGYPNIELKPGGSEIDVTIWNLEEYIELIIEHLLRRGISNQVEAFRKGFSEVISLSSLTMLNYFSFAELDDMICGCEEQWTVQYLMENTHCDHGYTNSSRAVQYFFSVLSQMNSTEQRLFLKFVTGCVKLPSGGLKALSPKMTIVLKPVPSDAPSLSPDMFLPSVMTCANFIKLPNYSSEHVLKTQLMKAIEHGQNSFLLS